MPWPCSRQLRAPSLDTHDLDAVHPTEEVEEGLDPDERGGRLQQGQRARTA